jgi:general secretion pathway protein K
MERGVAMIMVLAAISLLYVMAEQIRDEVLTYSLAASVGRDQLIAEYQARSAVNLARVLLHAEPTIRRAITPVLTPLMAMMGRGFAAPPQIPIWEQADLILGPFRSQEGGQMLSSSRASTRGGKNLGGLTGLSPVVICDEDAKINVNSAVRSSVQQILLGRQLAGLGGNPRLEPYFAQRDVDGQFTDLQTFIANAVDYVDFDETAFDAQSLLATNAQAASTAPEDSFFTQLRPAYRRRNAPLDSVQEMRMFRGLGDDDLWNAMVDPDPSDPRRRTLTVWGQGAVNVNTANAQTLRAHRVRVLARRVALHRPRAGVELHHHHHHGAVAHAEHGHPLFNSAQNFVATIQGRPPMGPMLQTLGLQPFVVRNAGELERSITTESKVFSVMAEASVGAAHVRLHAVIDMRAQPALPSTFLRASGVTLAQTAGGAPAVVSSQGGTIIYWREE